MTSFESKNPATGEVFATYPATPEAELDGILERADAAQRAWAERPIGERTDMLLAVAGHLRGGVEEYAGLMAREMGKPLADGRSEVEKCAWVCDYYAENAADFLADEPIESDAARSWVTYRPLGLVLAIMPWNFPFWQLFRFAAPALAAGNGVLLKHASNVPGCSLALQQIFHDALDGSGASPELFRSLLIDSDVVGDIVEHPRVRAVTLTGSTRAGRAVAAEAGEQLKPIVLELGGSDPYLVLEDADLEAAAEACVTSRLINSGQSCIAAKRFVVVDAVRARFESLVVEKMAAITMGDPMDEDVDIGPMARHDLRDTLHDQVERSVAEGAGLLLGGEIPEGPGAYYPPTVLTDVGPGMAAYSEELFGPVAAILPVADEEEAIQVANDTSFGLGAAVFTCDVARGETIAATRLEAGSCFVNDFVRSDPRLPFGGIKESGYGRELSRHGIREFVNAKTVWIAPEG